jgi:hypothetical protein
MEALYSFETTSHGILILQIGTIQCFTAVEKSNFIFSEVDFQRGQDLYFFSPRLERHGDHQDLYNVELVPCQ